MSRNLVNLPRNCAVFVLILALVATVAAQEEDVLEQDRWKEESCKMIVKKCTTMYTKILNVNATSDEHVCFMLQAYKHCLLRNVSTCAVDKEYDTLMTVISRLLHGLCEEKHDSREHEGTSVTGVL